MGFSTSPGRQLGDRYGSKLKLREQMKKQRIPLLGLPPQFVAVPFPPIVVLPAGVNLFLCRDVIDFSLRVPFREKKLI
jgi:hypothetical protein